MQTSRRQFLAGLRAVALARAHAIAISGGRFFAVGSNDEGLQLATPLTRKVDLGWKIVLPGFNDAHAHPGEFGRRPFAHGRV